jgi:hypothetical protein
MKIDSERLARLIEYATVEGRRECSEEDARLICRAYNGNAFDEMIDDGYSYLINTHLSNSKINSVVCDITIEIKKNASDLYGHNIGAMLGAYVVLHECILERPAFEELAAACVGFIYEHDPNFQPVKSDGSSCLWLDSNGFYKCGKYEGKSVCEVVETDPIYVWKCYYSDGMRRIVDVSNENTMFRIALYGKYGIRDINFRFSAIEYEAFDMEYVNDRYGNLE